MRVVWKYKVPRVDGEFEMSIPQDAAILEAELQDGEPHLWCFVDPSAPVVTSRRFRWLMTGEKIDNWGGLVHVKSFHTNGLVVHLFQKVV